MDAEDREIDLRVQSFSEPRELNLSGLLHRLLSALNNSAMHSTKVANGATFKYFSNYTGSDSHVR